MKHTPTPWLADHDLEPSALYSEDVRIAEFLGGEDAQRENAEFAARAVNAHADLLAALEDIFHVAFADTVGNRMESPEDRLLTVARRAKEALAKEALAKATGK